MKLKLLIGTACMLVASLALAQHKVTTTTKHTGTHLGRPVLSSPFIGVRSMYDASDLITNFPWIDEDLRILIEHQNLPDVTAAPRITLSGNVTGQITAWQNNRKRMNSDINLTGAELDVLASVSNWANALIVVMYDDRPSVTYPYRENNSRLQINRGFLTIGNLDRLPYYFSIGQMYMPFGDYGTLMITDPLTKTLGRILKRGAVLGYYQNGVYTSVFAFQGATTTRSRQNKINNGGVNLGYRTTYGKTRVELGGSYVLNIADSDGINAVLGSGPNSISNVATTRKIAHRVPAYDARANFGYGPFGILGEYVATTHSFDEADLNYRGKATKLNALHVEGSYKFTVMGKPSAIALAYDQSWRAPSLSVPGALLFPRYSYVAVLATSIWKDTVEKLEYRYNTNYSKSTYVSTVPGVSNSTGTTRTLEHYLKHNHIITFQIEAFF